jgi:hypothetical protein
MKRILFLIFIVIGLYGCKKDSDNSTRETLSGKWATGGYNLELYNSSGVKVSHLIADAIKTYWTFDDKQVKVSTDLNTQVIVSEYTLKRNVDNRVLSFSNPQVARQADWRIEEQTDKYMRITSEITDKKSLVYGNNQTAARGVMTIYLNKE